MADDFEAPAWFDDERHVRVSNGVMDRVTGNYLASDGRPLGGPARAAQLAADGLASDELAIVGEEAIASAASAQAAEAVERADAERAEASERAAIERAEREDRKAERAAAKAEKVVATTADTAKGD